MCLKNKAILHTTQKHFPSFNYWKKCGESVSLLGHLVSLTNIFFDDKASASNTENH